MKKIITYLPMAAIFVATVLFFALPVQDFSENENRFLKKPPKLEAEALLDGKYTAGLEEYVSDHFPFRDALVGLHSMLLKASGAAEISGIYVMPDHVLAEAYEHPEDTERIIRILKDFAGKVQDRNISLMLVPTAVSIYNDRLPDLAPDKTGSGAVGYISQQDTIDRIFENIEMNTVTCGDILYDHRDEYIFYNSDHHWTSLGAYYGYLSLCESMGLSPVDINTLEKRVVTEDFQGTLYSRSGDYSVKRDTMEIYGDVSGNVRVEYSDTGAVTDSLYNMEYLDTKDKYAMYLDRVHDLTHIESLICGDGRKLVLIKDSYANAMLPFLVYNFSEIYVFDTRYYKNRVSEFINEHPDVTDVLLLFNMNTFDRDLAVKGIY